MSARKPATRSADKSFFYSWTAVAIAEATTVPIDTVKVRLQLQVRVNRYGAASLLVLRFAPRGLIPEVKR